MNTQLHLYQKQAISRFHKNPHGLLVTLPPGTGKSIVIYQAIEDLGGPILLCSYKYVLLEHQYSIPNFIPQFKWHHVESSKHVLPKITNNLVLMITPSILRMCALTFAHIKFKLMVFDESHMFKNRTSGQTKGALAITQSQPNAKALLTTATPCPETIGELQPQIQIINPYPEIGRGPDFATKYERKKNIGSFWKKYYINKDEIKVLCKPYIFRKKKESLPLPEQHLKRIYVEMPTELRDLYEEFKEECMLLITETPDKDPVNVICASNAWAKLLQICAGFIKDTKASKVEGKEILYQLSTYKTELVADIAQAQIYPTIVWGTFREELRMLHKAIPGSKLVMGGTKNGMQIVRDFKDGKFKNLVANPQCIGAGVSLEIAGAQVAGSVNASCALYEQTVARTNRITQTKDVTRYEVIYKNTIEERVFAKVTKKVKVQQSILRDICKEEFGL